MKNIKKLIVILVVINLITMTLCVIMWYRGNYTDKLLVKLGMKNKTMYQADYRALVSWESCLKNLNINADVAFYGDSIMRGGKWQEYFPGVSVVNLGYSGDSIEGLNTRIGMIEAVKAKKVFIMIGVNDIQKYNCESIILDGYKELLDKLNAYDSNMQVYVFSILPTNQPNERDNKRTLIVNSKLQELVKTYPNVLYIDSYSSLADSDGKLNMDYSSGDGVHLNDLGYKSIVDNITKYIVPR